MVMLYAEKSHSTLLQGPFRREIVGMQVVGDDRRSNFQNSLEMLDGLVEEAVTLRVLQISNVLAQERVFALGQANRVLKLASHRQHRRLFVFQENRHGDKSARTSHLARYTAGNPYNRIIAAQQNLAIMHQEVVSQPS